MLRVLVTGITDSSTVHNAGYIIEETAAMAALADGPVETRPGKPNYHPWHAKHGRLVERVEEPTPPPPPVEPVKAKK